MAGGIAGTSRCSGATGDCFRRTAVGPGKIRIPDGGIQKEHAGGKRSWQLTEACRNAVCNHLLAESGRGAGNYRQLAEPGRTATESTGNG